eukprot:1701703-Rhodomonas_salina.1
MLCRVAIFAVLAASASAFQVTGPALSSSFAPASSPLALRQSAKFAGASSRRVFAPVFQTRMAELTGIDKAKQAAGYKSVDDHVTSGMVVGLGTGSTAYFAVERVGQKLKSGELKDIICIPTSERTREQAESLDIPLCTLNEKSTLDVAIDGADAVDPDFALVKGGGGALLREKMVEVIMQCPVCLRA